MIITLSYYAEGNYHLFVDLLNKLSWFPVVFTLAFVCVCVMLSGFKLSNKREQNPANSSLEVLFLPAGSWTLSV